MSLTLYSKIMLFNDEYVRVICVRPDPKIILNDPDNILSFNQKKKLEYLLTIIKSFNQPKLSIFDFEEANDPLQCYSKNCDLIFTINSLPELCYSNNNIPLSYQYLPDLLNVLMLKGFVINNIISKISNYLGFYSSNSSRNSNLICNLQF